MLLFVLFNGFNVKFNFSMHFKTVFFNVLNAHGQ